MIVLPRRVGLVAFALTLAPILSWPAALQAQDYPTRPVRIIVPFGAGGPADVYSRVLAQHLSDALKQPFWERSFSSHDPVTSLIWEIFFERHSIGAR